MKTLLLMIFMGSVQAQDVDKYEACITKLEDRLQKARDEVINSVEEKSKETGSTIEETFQEELKKLDEGEGSIISRELYLVQDNVWVNPTTTLDDLEESCEHYMEPNKQIEILEKEQEGV